MTKVKWRLLGKSLIACIAGAILGPPLFLICWGIVRAFYATALNHDPLNLGIYIAGLFPVLGHFVMAALSCVLVLGLPAQALLQYFKLTGYLSNIVVAAIGGAIVEYTAAYALGHFFTILSDPIVSASGAVAAVCVGSVAWLVRRPDKDAA